MAEGILRHFYGDSYDVASAGIALAGVNMYAIKVLREAGVDITTQRSKALKSLPGGAYDLIVTICDEAGCVAGALPPAGRVLHHPFPSPMEMGSEEDVLDGFRELRDRRWVWIQDDFHPWTGQDPLMPRRGCVHSIPVERGLLRPAGSYHPPHREIRTHFRSFRGLGWQIDRKHLNQFCHTI